MNWENLTFDLKAIRKMFDKKAKNVALVRELLCDLI